VRTIEGVTPIEVETWLQANVDAAILAKDQTSVDECVMARFYQAYLNRSDVTIAFSQVKVGTNGDRSDHVAPEWVSNYVWRLVTFMAERRQRLGIDPGIPGAFSVTGVEALAIWEEAKVPA
jgi:hypothetical protein